MSSCSLMMPYHEEKLCTKGKGEGVCGSLSDVYEDTVAHPENYGIPRRR